MTTKKSSVDMIKSTPIEELKDVKDSYWEDSAA